MSIADKLRSLFGGRRDEGPEAEEIKALTNQFYVSLHAYLSAVETHKNLDSDAVLARIRALAEKPVDARTWQDAYDLEQQLVLLFDDATLETELGRRLLEARTSLPSEVVSWYESAARTDDVARKRSLLTRLVNDIQWRYTKDEARRGYTKQITRRTEIVFTVSALLLAVTVMFVIAVEQAMNAWLILPFVGMSGAFGAAFSMMTSLKARLADSTFDDLKLNRSWGLILARILVGIGASYVLYAFLASGLLSGQAFPALVTGAVRDAGGGSGGAGDAASGLVLSADFAKLFIWSFISGFSEKFVPNLLARTEGQQGEPAQLPPQARRGVPFAGDGPGEGGTASGRAGATAAEKGGATAAGAKAGERGKK